MWGPVVGDAVVLLWMKAKLLHRLLRDPTYKSWLKTTLDRYQLRRQDVESCMETIRCFRIPLKSRLLVE